jgi:hypothetical protein
VAPLVVSFAVGCLGRTPLQIADVFLTTLCGSAITSYCLWLMHG